MQIITFNHKSRHMKRILLAVILFISTISLRAQPEVTSWIINTTGATGFMGIPSNVQQVQYGTNNVYVTTTCIPSYTIGPWPGNPNTATNQNYVFKITRNPIENSGTKTATPLGHIGVWSNGVSIFNALDAMSYNNQGVWHQNAQYWEGSGFDNCLGHPNQQGEYHHHVNPTCLYDDADSLNHSPIIGYAFDGFPIYGAYGYDNAMSPGATRRMVSGYELRNITNRDTLPDGTPASQAGPAVSSFYRLGAYVEDYAFTGNGDLDEHNGRICVTPDYPSGTYAYFVTIDENLDPIYPYVIGTTYYGVVQSGNTGPGSGHNTPSEPVQIYTPTSVSEIHSTPINIFPNPTNGSLNISKSDGFTGQTEISIFDMKGQLLIRESIETSSVMKTIDLSPLPTGAYVMKVNGERNVVSRILKF